MLEFKQTDQSRVVGFMKLKDKLAMWIVLVWSALLQFAWTTNVSLHEDNSGELNELGQNEGYFTCQCGSTKHMLKKALDVTFAEKLFNGVAMSHENISESFRNNSVIKEYMKKCAWCQVSFNRCFENFNVTNGKRFCLKKTAEFTVSENNESKNSMNQTKVIVKRRTEIFPKVIDIPIGGYRNYSRQTRHAEACAFPNALETAAMNCRVFPSSVKCLQRCAFGYTLDNGIQQKMECIKKENKWKPTGFKECQPFVDCTMALMSGGSAKCKTATLLKGPECAIECLHYEDKEAVPKTNYSCNIDGLWDPPLPFCASRGSGLVLAKAPEIKFHEE